MLVQTGISQLPDLMASGVGSSGGGMKLLAVPLHANNRAPAVKDVTRGTKFAARLMPPIVANRC